MLKVFLDIGTPHHSCSLFDASLQLWLAHVSRIVEEFRYSLVDWPFIFPVYAIFLGAKVGTCGPIKEDNHSVNQLPTTLLHTGIFRSTRRLIDASNLRSKTFCLLEM
jgi:hypothetical protein